jgi:hypothetical protein
MTVHINGPLLLATLATPRPTEDALRHVITTTRVDGYLCTVCACGSGLESLGWDESSKNASAYWAREHKNQGVAND